ncbi:MAG: DUF2703 domain-containing protein [Thermovirgaceae bacterium]
MNRIILRHYAGGESTCDPVVKTRETLKTLLEQMGPKMEKIGFQVVMKEEDLSDTGQDERKNMITLACPEMDFGEKPLEEIIGAEAAKEECSCGDGTCRSLKLEGQSYQAVPPGLITDGMLRVAFSAMGAMAGGGCGSCCGDCSGCGI